MHAPDLDKETYAHKAHQHCANNERANKHSTIWSLFVSSDSLAAGRRVRKERQQRLDAGQEASKKENIRSR